MTGAGAKTGTSWILLTPFPIDVCDADKVVTLTGLHLASYHDVYFDHWRLAFGEGIISGDFGIKLPWVPEPQNSNERKIGKRKSEKEQGISFITLFFGSGTQGSIKPRVVSDYRKTKLKEQTIYFGPMPRNTYWRNRRPCFNSAGHSAATS